MLGNLNSRSETVQVQFHLQRTRASVSGVIAFEWENSYRSTNCDVHERNVYELASEVLAVAVENPGD